MKNRVEIKNSILSEYLIDSSHDLKSIGGLIVSGVISTFGVYGIIRPFFDSMPKLYISILAFIIVLIIFDTIKRGALSKYLNSLLKKKIIGSKVKQGYLVIAIFATIFMMLLDGLGSWTTAQKATNLYTEWKTNHSTEYQILKENAENGKIKAQNYTTLLETWKESKRDAYQNCNDKWRGWKSKYKARCKEKWDNKNPMPKDTSSSNIKIDDYKSIQEDRKGFIDEWLQTILFILLLIMTFLMQYLTIAKIYDDYNEIEESLTSERIDFINDTIQEHETILAEHEQQVAELMANSTREKKSEDRKFKEVGEAIAITHKKKMVKTRAKTVLRIANNEYVPQEKSKAGFVNFSFNSDETVKPNGYNQTVNQSVKSNRENNTQKENSNQSVNQTVITEPLTVRLDSKLFTNEELKLINILWDNGNIKTNDSLVTRREVLKVIGDTKVNTTLLRDLYKKLLGLDYIYKRVGYFAKVEL